MPFQHVPGSLEIGAGVVLEDSMEEVEVELDSEIYTGERGEQKNKTHRFSCSVFFFFFLQSNGEGKLVHFVVGITN